MMRINGCDAAIIGVGERCGMEPVVVYDHIKLVECLRALHQWDEDTAAEWIDYNILGAYVGEDTPIVVLPFYGDEDEYDDTLVQ